MFDKNLLGFKVEFVDNELMSQFDNEWQQLKTSVTAQHSSVHLGEEGDNRDNDSIHSVTSDHGHDEDIEDVVDNANKAANRLLERTSIEADVKKIAQDCNNGKSSDNNNEVSTQGVFKVIVLVAKEVRNDPYYKDLHGIPITKAIGNLITIFQLYMKWKDLDKSTRENLEQ